MEYELTYRLQLSGRNGGAQLVLYNDKRTKQTNYLDTCFAVVRLRAGVGEPPGAHEQVPLQERPRRRPEPVPAARERDTA